jgi:inhibitor of cysteine peptidase
MRVSHGVARQLALTVLAAALCGALIACAARLCSSAEAEQAGTEPVVLTITSRMSAGSAMPVAVRAGDQFSVSLPSNQTTGYSWRLAEGVSSAVLKTMGSRYTAPAPSGGLVGRGGTETWVFRALAKGKTTITLEYARPWEKGVKPEKHQVFAVVVS